MDSPIIMGITTGAALLLGLQLMLNLQKINVAANRWLGLFITTLGLAMAEMLLAGQNFQQTHPALFEIVSLSRFITAPALYLSIVYFTSLETGFKPKYLLHFLPFAAFFVFRIPFFITGENLQFSAGASRVIMVILIAALPLQSIIYWCLSLLKLKKHIRDLRQFSSSTEKNGLLWLRNFLLIVGLIIFIWSNLLFLKVDVLTVFTPLCYLLSIFFLAWFSLQQKEIFDFTKTQKSSLSEVVKDEPIDIIQQKRLSDNRLEILNKKLEHLITTEKIYLENELSLPAMAEKLGCTSNEASYLINKAYNENFYSFINRHRVDEAKSLLLSGQYSKLSIIGIAYQSGFNSKTTFNITFKKHTGLSPTQFVKQYAGQTA
jgi:AraC-like DNA-binding protein